MTIRNEVVPICPAADRHILVCVRSVYSLKLVDSVSSSCVSIILELH